jgi:plastocyanin
VLSNMYVRVAAVLVAFAFATDGGRQNADAERRPKQRRVTNADLERLEKKVEEQQKRIDALVQLQRQYLQALSTLFPADSGESAPPPANNQAPDSRPAPATSATPEPVEPSARPPREARKKPPKKIGLGTLVGKVKGGRSDTFVYVADIVETTKASASMKQEGKKFVPKVLAVQKGTMVDFPNLDTIFHNVFSVTPDNSFDLGSYRKGESRSVTMSKPGVVSVYCNMHPQMVGYILVVPGSLYTRVGEDGFYRLPNIPAGQHRVVVWAPNAKPVSVNVEITEEVTTLELEVKRGREKAHLNKDNMPYGSYKD